MSDIFISTLEKRVNELTARIQEVSPSDWVNLNYNSGRWTASTFHTVLRAIADEPTQAIECLAALIERHVQQQDGLARTLGVAE